MCTLDICLKIKCHVFQENLRRSIMFKSLASISLPVIKFGDVESEPNQIGTVELTFPGFGSMLFWDCRQVSKPVLLQCICLYNDVVTLASGDMEKLKITWMERLEVSYWLSFERFSSGPVRCALGSGVRQGITAGNSERDDLLPFKLGVGKRMKILASHHHLGTCVHLHW